MRKTYKKTFENKKASLVYYFAVQRNTNKNNLVGVVRYLDATTGKHTVECFYA